MRAVVHPRAAAVTSLGQSLRQMPDTDTSSRVIARLSRIQSDPETARADWPSLARIFFTHPTPGNPARARARALVDGAADDNDDVAPRGGAADGRQHAKLSGRTTRLHVLAGPFRSHRYANTRIGPSCAPFDPCNPSLPPYFPAFGAFRS